MTVSPRVAVLIAVLALPLGAAVASYALADESRPSVPAEVRIGGDVPAPTQVAESIAPTATAASPAPPATTPLRPAPKVVVPPPPPVSDDDGRGGADDDGPGDDGDD